jgi:hypothetical protein
VRIALEKAAGGVLHVAVTEVERIGHVGASVHIDVKRTLVLYDEGTEVLIAPLKSEMSHVAFAEPGDVDADGV